MEMRHHEEPGTPVYGRPYDEEDPDRVPEHDDARAPEHGDVQVAGTGSGDPDPAHDLSTQPDRGVPDWSGTRYEAVPAAEPEPEPVHTGRDDALRRDDTADDTALERDGTTAEPDVADEPEPAAASPAAGDAAATATDSHWDVTEVRRRWHDVQVAFVDDPRDSVERADAMVEEVVASLTARRRELMDGWKNLGQGDTERLRLALRDYRSLLERLTGPFQGAADRGVK